MSILALAARTSPDHRRGGWDAQAICNTQIKLNKNRRPCNVKYLALKCCCCCCCCFGLSRRQACARSRLLRVFFLGSSRRVFSCLRRASAARRVFTRRTFINSARSAHDRHRIVVTDFGICLERARRRSCTRLSCRTVGQSVLRFRLGSIVPQHRPNPRQKIPSGCVSVFVPTHYPALTLIRCTTNYPPTPQFLFLSNTNTRTSHISKKINREKSEQQWKRVVIWPDLELGVKRAPRGPLNRPFVTRNTECETTCGSIEVFS